MAISRVISTQRVTTKSRSATLVETPRDSPDIQWTLGGILERHFCKQQYAQNFKLRIYFNSQHQNTKIYMYMFLVY